MKKMFMFVLFCCILNPPSSIAEEIFHPICNSSGATNCEVFPTCQAENTPYLSCYDNEIGRHVCCYSPPPYGGETTYPEPDYDNECAYLECIEVGSPSPCAWLAQPNGIECDNNNACTGGENLPIEERDSCQNGQCISGEINFNPATHCCHPDYSPIPGEEIGSCVNESCIPYADGISCGDDTATECTNPDTCLSGICRSNNINEGIPCDDEDDCTLIDSCTSGICEGLEPWWSVTILQKSGPRRLKVTVFDTLPLDTTVSLKLISGEWLCLEKYVSESGALYNYPIYRTIGDFVAASPIYVHGKDVVPETRYQVVTTCQNSQHPLFTNEKITPTWGDVAGDNEGEPGYGPPDGKIDFTDISAVVDAFIGNPIAPPMEICDIAPEMVNFVVDFTDIEAVVEAFETSGLYPYSDPCE